MASSSPPPPPATYTKMVQDYCQLYGLDLPMYKPLYRVKEDGAHHCLFTATFSGLRFRSPWSSSPDEACNGAAKSVLEFITSGGSAAFLTAAPPPSPAPTGVVDAHSYKNMLEDYTKKTRLERPIYRTVKVIEGPSYQPMFRSTVIVQNTPYTSPHIFAKPKSAEQDASRIALKCLHQNPKVQDFTFCKSILHEYAVKMHLKQPSYQTVQEEKGLLPVFVSTVHFDGGSYHTRVEGKTQKETEQLAARSVIRYILGNGNSDSFIVMSRIIQSKFKNQDVHSIFSADSKATSGCGSLPKDVLKERSTNHYLPSHPSKKRNLGISKQAEDTTNLYLPLHVSEKRDFGIPKQAVDPGKGFIPCMHGWLRS